ncbi:hypothetical protein HOG17_04345 [Candidatus Peregrinibacteria bacterium]|jgi:hypothetical protein|nr:hypothetical protein [Candidatus Peregrinibacteria bacterium]MBT4148460.1 hypothetical protein [Candidatus Peregrinibacteria bacterium]MBT4366533.1 hypothetical protein [Candidatus Peregrinibacteria bacterium]MBT4456501.1 hypothetical protein [Candidatus Peregrinibacteria bacterium]
MEENIEPVQPLSDVPVDLSKVDVNQSKKGKGLIGFVVLLVLIVGVGVAVYLFFFNRTDLVRYTSENYGYSFMYDANEYEILEGGVDWAMNLETKMSIRLEKGLYEFLTIYEDDELGKKMYESWIKITSEQHEGVFEEVFILDGEEFALVGVDEMFTADDGIERPGWLRNLSGEHDGREYYIKCAYYQPEIWETFVDTFVFE